jgi:hypothetical protein
MNADLRKEEKEELLGTRIGRITRMDNRRGHFRESVSLFEDNALSECVQENHDGHSRN